MKQISDKLFVRPQLTADDIRQARVQGFAAIINNRPDGEEPGQPTAAENRSVAEGEQLAYAHIPVTAAQVSEGQVRAFQKALSEAGGPVLAHCKTGTRSATLYAIGEVLDGRMEKDEVIPLGQSVGLDLSGAVKWLDAHGR
ncbi:TIGR01244 family phosphatase [Georhizobium profundi]|uniref:TIGR01244 family phosphatase n=1 Tax=Georhizobium profundi TaxID=2341112 RepID=A0A3S9B6J7_9HYPH|nr:TIGR01244 family sulfur transferase [Georhizobium profundi]AZN72585.1 TIGR01244 family phosphatase [Georhizobium profundi]